MRGWLAVPALLVLASAARADDLFESKIRPVLVDSCFPCHGAKKVSGGLRVDSRAALLEGGDTGPAVVPNDPAASLLLKAMRHEKGVPAMPPKKPMDPARAEAFAAWIRAGAKWPEATPAFEGERHWAFESVGKKAPALIASSPVDAYIDQTLRRNGRTPLGHADRRTLIRRATFDLTGLPPTPEAVEAFAADARPDAFAKVVDRLLASPRYGERWGRHWLDVVRYADSAGENSDHPLPHAWRYRNWVLSAFDRDKPYDEFIREQVAGDLLAKQGPAEKAADRIVATGYLAIARRFGHEIDKDIHLTLEDAIDTLGKSVLGLSIGCARCHTHKYDPITADDYYALYGILASTKFSFPGCEPAQQPRDLTPLPSAGKDALAYAVTEGDVKDARLHLRGDPEKLGKVVPRRWLSLFGSTRVPQGAGSGRLQLADWLTSADNPLTARVMVNRVWQHHFGKGLVKTPNDFGTRGAPPTHPELLDWLAADFVRSGWSVKHLHRRIVLSDAYRRAGGGSNEGDPANDSYWRFDRRRLSAEELRDALLVAGDTLDPGPAGPHPFPPQAKWNFTQHAPFNTFYETDRRSVYLMVLRNRRHPFLGLFDGADPNASTPERQVTTVPTQALYFMNDPFFHKQAAAFAGRLPTRPDEDRVTAAFRLLFQRPPTAREQADARRFLTAYLAALNDVPPGDRPRQAWAAYARVLLGSNEFLYQD